MAGHPSAQRLVLVDPSAVHRSRAALSLAGAEANLLRPEPVTRAQASPLCPAGLTRAHSNLSIADRGTVAEAHTPVANSRTRAERDTTEGC